MSNTIGERLKITIFGQSHSEFIGVVVDGLPAGFKIDNAQLEKFISRRSPGQALSTLRKEKDCVKFIAGLNEEGLTCGSALVGVIANTDVKSKDYSDIAIRPRPSHSDYTAFLKYGEGRDIRGGGQFSGRLTAPLCVAGGICKQLLNDLGIRISAHLSKVGEILDTPYDSLSEELEENLADFPALDSQKASLMQDKIKEVALDGNSIGGEIECKIVGVPATLGEPMFDGVESKLSHLIFSVPAVKGFEIGAGFSVSGKKGSENNDAFTITQEGDIRTVTNNDGGVNGGITNGMPIVFRVAIKPTPSIFKTQQSVNLNSGKIEELTIKGRHDPCIALRAVPVIEACAAIVLADMIL